MGSKKSKRVGDFLRCCVGGSDRGVSFAEPPAHSPPHRTGHIAVGYKESIEGEQHTLFVVKGKASE